MAQQQILACDIAIIGGGLGGVAAALAAAEAGKRVVMSEPTDWIGGQVTSQLVAPLDEHFYIETFGGTRAYYQFREGVRAYYRDHYPAARSAGEGEGGTPLNPGNGWVSRLCFEPRVGLRVLEDMLAPHVEAGRLRILLHHTPIGAEVRNGRIQSITLAGGDSTQVELRAEVFLDATEQGDLLPLTGAPYVIGAEAVEDTGEPHASTSGPQPKRVQSFTWCFLVEHCPGEDHTIRKPQGYDYYREAQPFSLVLRTSGGGYRRFRMFDGETPFWTYRRVFDAAQLNPGSFANGGRGARDIALINWDSNDYYKESPIDRSPAQQERILREARRLSLSFLYWLQTEAPHDNDPGLRPGYRPGQLSGGKGYPGLRLLPQATGTPDGLAKAPYIREARRVIGIRRVLEQDIIARPEGGVRADHYSDAVGVGWYPIDLHRCAGDPTAGAEERIEYPASLPFQVPLGAMLSRAIDNLIAAGKCISTTHITNGAYRLHPVEWAIGEAAGALAATCISDAVRPRVVWEATDRLRSFQKALLERGVPLAWTVDMGLQDADFTAIQSCLLDAARFQRFLMPESSPRFSSLEIRPDAILSRLEGAWLVERSPRATNNPLLRDVLAAWKAAPLGPFTGTDWRAACAALDLPAPQNDDYPTLRQVCRRLGEA